MDWPSRLETYLAEIENRINANLKVIVRQKASVFKLKTAGRDSTLAEKALATYHKEGLWLFAQRERVREYIAQIHEQRSERSNDNR